MKKHLLSRAALLGIAAPLNLLAVDLYWDTTGTQPGAGFAPTGTWDTGSLNWNPDPLGADTGGTTSLQAWASGSKAIFSAGSDVTDPYTVTVSGTQTASGIVVEDGVVSLAGAGAASIGAGPVLVGPGATLSTDSSLRIAATPGSVFTLNGGTLRSTNPGTAGNLIDSDATIFLGSGGGTISYTGANLLSIIQGTTIISGTGSLTKTGVGVIAIASASTYSGPTNILDGELRIRTNPDRLPTTTAVTVTSPGILNLNGLSQQIGSLSGNGMVGTGAGTLTISGSASTTFDGALKNIANAGAAAVTTGNGRLVKNGTGVITFTGVNDIKGSVTVNAGGIIVAPSGKLCDAIADVTVNTGGTLTLNNSAQTIENLSGTGGTIQLAAGHVLTISPVSTVGYAGIITGAGGIEKIAAATEKLTGANTYTGPTTITAGTLQLGDFSTALTLGSLQGTSKVDVLGVLSGAGTITPSSGGGITLLAGGKLSPGVGILGSLTASLSGGGKLDISAGVASANSQSLLFELGDPSASDKVITSGGALQIGTGVLGFDDFLFTTSAGFLPNTDYLLFDGTAAILGSLGADVTGTVGGYAGELRVADGGNDLILRVVPEPSCVAAALGGAGFLLGLRRRRR